MLIGDNLVVSMHYKLTDDDGNVLNSSEGSEPLSYLHGGVNIIPGLGKALVGKVEGDSLQVRVEPAEAYGEIMPMVFEAKAPSGSVQHFVVKKVDGDKVTIDANHPLAGVVLHFDIEIVGVREATEEEVAQDHAH
ncbi:MAG: peptidylprolyl isomerase [Deltaproteobacteria bacterium]|nr:peptidylprolyl isomerase [Deltaproteobacteria bacterium]